eukprot:gene10854-2930_t
MNKLYNLCVEIYQHSTAVVPPLPSPPQFSTSTSTLNLYINSQPLHQLSTSTSTLNLYINSQPLPSTTTTT